MVCRRRRRRAARRAGCSTFDPQTSRYFEAPAFVDRPPETGPTATAGPAALAAGDRLLALGTGDQLRRLEKMITAGGAGAA